jgi:uncharacterized protein (DUF2141 family)
MSDNLKYGRIIVMRLGLALLASAVMVCAVPASAQDMDLMQFADTNGDGKVTPEEFAAFREQGWGYFSQGAAKIKVADLDPMVKGAFVGVTPDADGYVTREAYLAATPARFKAADKNGDGTLDREELNNSVKPAG